MMRTRFFFFYVLLVAVVVLLNASALHAQARSAVPYQTIKVTDNVYIFQYGGSQSMFLVTPDGVIVADPINAQASSVYMAEIRKITSEPVRYVVYSHHHIDHVSGGALFMDAGATFVAHRQAKAALLSLGESQLRHKRWLMPQITRQVSRCARDLPARPGTSPGRRAPCRIQY